MTNQLYLRFYMTFVKWSSFGTPKVQLLLPINLLLHTNSRVLAGVQIMWEKPKERYMNVLNTHGVIKILRWKITSTSVLKCSTYWIILFPALFSNDSNIGRAENRNLHTNLVIENTNIIDRYKNFNFLLFKEALKIDETKPTLSTGLKASNELQLF